MDSVLHLCTVFILMGIVRTETTSQTVLSTEVSPTTSEPLSTPVPTPPVPKEGSWNVTDGNTTCIRADLKIRLQVHIDNDILYIPVPPNATTDGSNCDVSNNTQLLSLEGKDFQLSFYFGKESGNAFVKNITLELKLSEQELFFNDTKLFSVKNGNSYLCKTSSSVHLGNATLEIFEIHIQAFGMEEQHNFGDAEECEADEDFGIVPIVVACALAGLIIIVLIAYLVGRRRSRKLGYNSV